jgi:hypothetical protein
MDTMVQNTLFCRQRMTQLVKLTVVVKLYMLTQYVCRELVVPPRSGRKAILVLGCHLHRTMFDDIVLLFLPSWNKSDRLGLQLSHKDHQGVRLDRRPSLRTLLLPFVSSDFVC